MPCLVRDILPHAVCAGKKKPFQKDLDFIFSAHIALIRCDISCKEGSIMTSFISNPNMLFRRAAGFLIWWCKSYMSFIRLIITNIVGRQWAGGRWTRRVWCVCLLSLRCNSTLMMFSGAWDPAEMRVPSYIAFSWLPVVVSFKVDSAQVHTSTDHSAFFNTWFIALLIHCCI